MLLQLSPNAGSLLLCSFAGTSLILSWTKSAESPILPRGPPNSTAPPSSHIAPGKFPTLPRPSSRLPTLFTNYNHFQSTNINKYKSTNYNHYQSNNINNYQSTNYNHYQSNNINNYKSTNYNHNKSTYINHNRRININYYKSSNINNCKSNHINHY